MELRRILHPAVLFVAPVMASFLAWSVPGSSTALRGFTHRSELAPGGVALLVGWYLLCAAILVFAYRVGAATPPPATLERYTTDPALERRLFRLLWVLATVGVGYALIKAATTVDVLAVLRGGTANELTAALDGQAGVATLRYAAALALPVGVYLWRQGAVRLPEVVWSAVLLAVDAVFASRLAILMALVVFAFLHRARRPEARVRIRTVAIAVLVLMTALTLLNSLRNENYYAAHGVSSPLAANGYQLLTYVGSPFQVSLGVADAIAAGRYPDQYTAAHATGLWMPTFLRGPAATEQSADNAETRRAQGTEFAFSTDSLPRGQERYASSVDVADSLTTNSAFADVLSDFGYWGLLGLALTLGVVGLFLGHLAQYRSVIAAGAGIVGYGVAEMWRTYLFSQGIVVFLLVAVLGGAVALSVLSPARRSTPAGPTTPGAPMTPAGSAAS
jgi:hypothetical protein